MTDFVYASLRRRAAGALIDLLVYMAFTIAMGVSYPILFGEPIQPGTDRDLLISVITWGLWIAYYTSMEAMSGKTIGKYLTGVKVVTVDGKQLQWQAAFVRNLMRYVDMQFFYLVGAFLYKVSQRHQRLGDNFARTVVIRG